MSPNAKDIAKNRKIVVDPMTRIEGHLRIQATAVPVRNDHGGRGDDGRDRSHGYLITEPGLSSSTMVRGFEIIMKNRDPRDAWAFAQRICGVCTVVHGLTSVRAVENAVGLKVSKNADLIRNLMIGAQYVHDHVMHFYHLHALDWVDVVSALKANIAHTAALARANNPAYYATTTDQDLLEGFKTVKAKLQNLVDRNQLGLFGNGYWGHPAYLLRPEQNLLLVSHYLDALDWAPDIVLVHAIFGGKDPHPDLLVGGMQYPFSSSDFTDIDVVSGLPKWRAIIENSIRKMQHFVDNVYIPDVALAASVYKDWANYGATEGNFLCFGEFPDQNLVQQEFVDGAIDYPDGYLIPQGVIWKDRILQVNGFDEKKGQRERRPRMVRVFFGRQLTPLRW